MRSRMWAALTGGLLGSSLASPFLASPSGGCDNGVACRDVSANGLTFQCRFAGEGLSDRKGDVMLLHGFPEWSLMYVDLMRALAEKGFRSVACNQRAYSPGASPEGESNYAYHLLRDDTFAVANAIGFDKFHLVGHDHGAVLGWWTTGSDEGKRRLLSYSGTSIPHIDAFSDGLFGPTADKDQQIGSQYFTMFVLPDSASIHMGFWYNLMGRWSGFDSAEDFQKALWWYNGAMGDGVLSMPPLMTSAELWESGSYAIWSLRQVFGGDANPGKAATARTGATTMPALFVCGNSDITILCAHDYARKSRDHCTGGYHYLEVECGHDILACKKADQTKRVMDGIIAHISGTPFNYTETRESSLIRI